MLARRGNWRVDGRVRASPLASLRFLRLCVTFFDSPGRAAIGFGRAPFMIRTPLRCALVAFVPLAGIGCWTYRVGGPFWSERIGLEVPTIKKRMGEPFGDGSTWSWEIRFAWDAGFPLTAELRIADLGVVPDGPSERLLGFELEESPADVSVHVVGVDGAIPEAAEVELVVSAETRLHRARVPNPFRDTTGGSPTPMQLSLDDPARPAAEDHLALQLLHSTFDARRPILLFVDLRSAARGTADSVLQTDVPKGTHPTHGL